MLECKILTTESEIEALADQWRELYARTGRSPFANYDLFSIWWNVIGKSDAQRQLHVIAGYENGKLTGVLPLTVIRSKGLRIMQAAGYRTYNCCDMLAENTDQAIQLWGVAQQSPHYDFADIRDVYPESLCHEALGSFAHRRDLSDTFFLRFEWAKGEDWLAVISGHERRNFLRNMRRLEEVGPVRYEVYREQLPPAALIQDMIQRKVAWSIAQKKHGLFEHPDVLSYFQRLLESSAVQRSLFWAVLKCGGHAIGYNQGFIHQNILRGVLWVYDPDWARFSPGSVVMTHSVLWAIDHGLKGLDFRQGENQYKRLHANEKDHCAEFTFNNGSLRSQLVEKAYIAARCVMRLMRGDPEHAVAED